MKLENISLEVYKQFIDGNYQEKTLQSLKEVLPNLNHSFQGRIEYTPVSHHVWLTNMEKPRDILTYSSDVFKYNQYNPNKVPGAIDDPNNAFIGSLINLEKGAKESDVNISDEHFYHVIWTNFSREDLIKHPELQDLRRICRIDKTQIALPEIIVLNIEEVMDSKDINEIKNQANLNQPLPKSILSGLANIRDDFLSVRPQLDDLYSKKMFASMSDIVRVAAVKDIGGIYFDLDYNLYEQSRLHKNNQYNIFDLMKHYDSILGKEISHGIDNRLCNAIISGAKPASKVIESIWETIKKNISEPNAVDYIKYPQTKLDYIICQTGPIATTVGFLKAAGQYDIALDFGALYYNEFKRPPHEVKLHGSVGAIGYDTWGGSWLECKYNQYKRYQYFDSETGRGITTAEWEAIFDL